MPSIGDTMMRENYIISVLKKLALYPTRLVVNQTNN